MLGRSQLKKKEEKELTKIQSLTQVADYSAQAVVNAILYKSFPTDPIVGEEDSKDLRGEEGRSMREKVLELANTGLESALTEDSVSPRSDLPRPPAFCLSVCVFWKIQMHPFVLSEQRSIFSGRPMCL